MAAESVSFRITRTTEDLAQTVAALSQRLVKLEQRFGALELQIERLSTAPELDPEELRRLDHVASLLADCRSLLNDEAEHEQLDHDQADHSHHDHGLAA